MSLCFTPFAELGADGRYAGCYPFIYSSFHRFTSIWSYGGWQLTVTHVPPKPKQSFQYPFEQTQQCWFDHG
jgi:hypothetical protein